MLNKIKAKIRKRREKKKGFTLVELLAVIVILAVIMVITIPSVLGNVNNAKKKAFNIAGETIVKYLVDNYKHCKLGNKNIANYDEYLFIEGTCKLKNNIINGKDNTLLKNSGYENEFSKIIVSEDYEGNFEVKVFDKEDEDIYYSTGEIVYVPNSPDLSNGLIPVVYDGENKTENGSGWFVADISTKWYNYDEHEWANAVSVDSSNASIVGKYINTDHTYKSDVEIATNDMLAMFVWIPRFSYTIGCSSSSSCLGYKVKEASDLSLKYPGAIDVRFISQTKTDLLDLENDFPTYEYEIDDNGMPKANRAPIKWYTPTAFSWDINNNGDREPNEELSGIWVAKFETSGDMTIPTILPNKKSLRQMIVSDQFNTSKRFTALNNKYGLSGDAHMMKNSEWGAVAYLSQSKYGKYGNDDYSGKYKEIYSNASKNYITGSSAGDILPSIVENPCSYDEFSGDRAKEIGQCGPGASTSGTIYGVYDMAGGAVETVMGYYEKAIEGTTYPWGATSSGDFAGFTIDTKPELKYYDVYQNNEIQKKSKSVIGHATYETSAWYDDFNYKLSNTAPWVIRDGTPYSQAEKEIFAFRGSDGNVNYNTSFRVSLINY